MTITINQTFFYYWIIAIVFETIYTYITFKIEWEKFKKKKESYETLMVMINTFKQMAYYKLLWKSILNPATCISAYIIFCLIAPILFPFSLLKLIRRLFGKTKLEKKAEEEEQAIYEAQQRSKEWLKNEGEVFEDEPITF